MAPKRSEKSKPKEEEQREEPLQAVILADSYEKTFAPFTLERPRCLLPLAGTPIIEYTLEFLAANGVEEVFVWLGSHADQVEEYLKNSKWNTDSRKSTSSFEKLQCFRSGAKSVGESMRDIDARGILKSDFVLVYGDLVSNINLSDALQKHKQRRIADKDSVMTIVLSENNARTYHPGYSPCFVTQNDRLLQYFQMMPRDPDHSISLDSEILLSSDELDLRIDLQDNNVDILSPDALALWSDYFDFVQPRAAFLTGVLKDYELNFKKIHCHTTPEYTARVRNLRAYNDVTRDIISRRAYPLCPEINLLYDQTYQFQKKNIYREENVVLHRSATVERNTAIGKGTSIGAGSVLTNCTIGRNCMIGQGVRISDSHIFDDTSVGASSKISNSILAAEVQIGKDCSIEDSLLSWSTRISAGTILLKRRIIRKREDGGETQPEESSYFSIGKDGEGYEYQPSEDEEEGAIEDGSDADSISTLNSEAESDVSFEPRDRSTSFISIGSEDPEDPIHAQQSRDFLHEASKQIFEGLEGGVDPDNIALELNALRLSEDASDHSMRKSLASSFAKHLATPFSPKRVSEQIENNVSLFNRYIDKDEESAVDILLLLQNEALKYESGDTLLFSIATALVNKNVIDADGVEAWWNSPKSTETEALANVRGKTKQLVEYLLASDDEESDEDDSEEDSD